MTTAKKKPTAAQLEVRRKFAERARAGTLKKGAAKKKPATRKAPARKKNPDIHIDVASHNTRGKGNRARNPVKKTPAPARYSFYVGIRAGTLGPAGDGAPFVAFWDGTGMNTIKARRLAFASYDAAHAEYKRLTREHGLHARQFWDIDIVQHRGK